MYSFKYKTVYFINDVGAKIRKANNNDNKNLILLTYIKPKSNHRNSKETF